MARKSPLGIEGTSLTFRDPDIKGRMTVAMVRAKDEGGHWRTKRFPVESWRRDGSAIIPDVAKSWARETRKDFIKGKAVARAATFQEFAALLIEEKAGTVTEHRLQRIRLVAEGLLKAGITDMQSDAFPIRVRKWIDSLYAGWSFPQDSFNRRKKKTPLSPATKNKHLIICRQVTSLAVRRRRLAYDPLADLSMWKQERKQKAIFSIDELRYLVSNKARYHAAKEKARLESVITAHQNNGLTRTSAVKRTGAEEGKHWSTIYNILKREANDDPWWLACCLLVYTGCRVDEAMHLRWEWIDWKAGHIHLRLADDYGNKSQSERLIPLEPELREILSPLAKPDGHIIPAHIRSGGSGEIRRVGKKGGGKA
ncbi:MAG: hypothetical protein EA401_12220, partial [Planctomycetota bacterium]